MKIDYTVHSAVREAVQVKAMVGGVEVDALVRGLTVELVTDGSLSHTLRIVPGDGVDIEEEAALFKPGARITGTFAAAETE